MKENDSLEYHYSGDIVWNRILSLAKKEWTNSKSQKQLVYKLKGSSIDMAIVMYAKLGEESMDWIFKKVPALENLTPLECLESPALIKRLKECLMRMS